MHLQVSRKYIRLQIPTSSISHQIKLDGMSYDTSEVRFESGIWSVDQAAVVSAALTGGIVSVVLATNDKPAGGEFKPGKRELQAINERHAEYELSAEDVYIYRRAPVNNVPSRTIGLRFDDDALAKFALDAKGGRARLRGHVRNDIVGRVFDGEVAEGTIRGISGKWLLTTEYVPARTVDGEPMNAELRTNIVQGVFGFDSIGFHPGSKIEFKEFEVGDTKRSIIEIGYDPSEQTPVEMREISFVHLGELKGVGSRKLDDGEADDEPAGAVFYPSKEPSVVVSGHKQRALWELSV